MSNITHRIICGSLSPHLVAPLGEVVETLGVEVISSGGGVTTCPCPFPLCPTSRPPQIEWHLPNILNTVLFLLCLRPKAMESAKLRLNPPKCEPKINLSSFKVSPRY